MTGYPIPNAALDDRLAAPSTPSSIRRGRRERD